MEEYQDYKLILAKGSDKLSKLVTEELNAGYVVHGSPVISTTFLGLNEDGSPKVFILVGQAVGLPFPDDDYESESATKEVYPAIKE